jgi:hypothetical protein
MTVPVAGGWAQEAGVFRRDVEIGDLEVLVGSCASRGDEAARERMTAIVRTGLRP